MNLYIIFVAFIIWHVCSFIYHDNLIMEQRDEIEILKMKLIVFGDDLTEFKKGVYKYEEDHLNHLKNMLDVIDDHDKEIIHLRDHVYRQFKTYDDGNEMMSTSLIEHTRWLERLDEKIIELTTKKEE